MELMRERKRSLHNFILLGSIRPLPLKPEVVEMLNWVTRNELRARGKVVQEGRAHFNSGQQFVSRSR